MQLGIIVGLLQLCLEVVHLRLLIGLPLLQFLPAGILLLLQPIRCAVPRFFVGVLGGFQLRFGIDPLLLQVAAAQLLEGGIGGLQAVFGGLQIGAQLGAGKLQRMQFGILYRGKMETGIFFAGIVAVPQIYHIIILGQDRLQRLDFGTGDGRAE